MKKNIKKIILPISIILAVSILAIASYYTFLYFRTYNIVKDAGVSFRYPKGLEIKRDEYTSAYITYQIRTEFKYTHYPANEASILVKIPTKDHGLSMSLAESIERDTTLKTEDYIIPLQETIINGNKGMIVRYRDNRIWPGEPPMHGFDTIIHLESKYNNSPVILLYNERDTDPDSLDKAWEMILSSIKF